MKKAVIIYTTKYGQTEKIVHYMAQKLKAQGFDTEMVDVKRTLSVMTRQPDLYIVGAPVFALKYPRPVITWVKQNLMQLKTKRAAFFSVSLNAADKRASARKGDENLIKQFVQETGWSPQLSASIAGSLNYPAYWWPIRLIMKKISRRSGGSIDTSKNHEYTDWGQVDKFLGAILQEVPVSEPLDHALA